MDKIKSLKLPKPNFKPDDKVFYNEDSDTYFSYNDIKKWIDDTSGVSNHIKGTIKR